MLDLSVIILARNEELHIRRCLENILPVAKEVFVIDCFSTDNTTAICREYPRVKVISMNGPACTPSSSTGLWTTAPSPQNGC